MSLFKSAREIGTRAAKLTGRVGADALKATGDAISEAKEAINANQPAIAAKTHQLVEAIGNKMEEVGVAVTTAVASSAANRSEPAEGDSRRKRVLHRLGGYAIGTYGAAGMVTKKVGASTTNASPVVGATAGGAISGVAESLSGFIDSVAITDRHFDEIYRRIRLASPRVKAETDRKTSLVLEAQRQHSKKDLLDTLVVGGVSLATIVSNPSRVPADIEKAFELAYPGLAGAGESFADAADRLPPEDLVGLVSGVKGKLFEVQLAAHLNDGNLPDGLRAELAGSATQPGFDIQIVDEHDQVVDVLQAKATEAVAYVQEALERYPGIDVSTTTEVHAQLMALGAVDNIHNSGISERLLEEKVQTAAASGDHLDASDLIPSSIGLAVIALSSFLGGGSLSLDQRGAEFGDRAAKASVAGTAAAVALLATNTWWLALVAGLGSRSLTTYGGNKRQRYAMLERIARTLETNERRTVQSLPLHSA